MGRLIRCDNLCGSMGLCITSVLLDVLDHGRNQQETARQVKGSGIHRYAAAHEQQKDANQKQERRTSQK